MARSGTGRASARQPRSRRLGTGVLVVIAVAISAVLMATLSARAITSHRGSCSSNPVRLNVAVTDDLAPAIERIAESFNAAQRAVPGRCTRVAVFAEQSAAVAGQIDGQGSQTGIGPVDAWIPDSSLWVDVARSFPLGARAVQTTGVSVARSPLMIVMPRWVARETRVLAAPAGWNVLLPAAEGGPPASLGIHVDLPDPADSSAGLATLVELTRFLHRSPAAQAIFNRFALSAQATAQFDDPTSLAAFAATASAPLQRRPLTVTTEQAVIAYDRANPREPLAAQYPSTTVSSDAGAAATAASLGTSELDYPYVLTTSSAQQLQAARAFEQALRQPYAADVIRYDGFRSADGASDTTPASFGLADQVFQQAPAATASEAQTTLEKWGKLQIGSRDLLLADVSATMSQASGSGSQTLEQELSATAELGLELLPGSTQLGEWQIASHFRGGLSYQPLAGVAPLLTAAGTSTRRQELEHASQVLQPGHRDLALNDAILAAYKQQQASYQPGYANTVIVLTAGVASAPDDLSTSALLARLHALASPGHKVEIIAVMLGRAGDFTALSQIAAATGGSAYEITKPAQAGQIFLQAVTQHLCIPRCVAP